MHDCLKPAYIRTFPSLQQAEAQRALNGSYSVVTIFARKYAQTRPGPDGLGRLPRLLPARWRTLPTCSTQYRPGLASPPPILVWWPFPAFSTPSTSQSPLTLWNHYGSESGRGFNSSKSAITRHLAIPTTPPSLHFVASQRIVLATPPHVYDADLDRICGGLAALFSHGEEPISSQLLQDLVDGVGGSRRLALFIASILNRICPRLDVPPTTTNIQNVAKITQFLGATTFTEGASDVWFTQALGRRRPITAMTNALRSLTLTPTSTNAVAGAFGVLLHLLTITPSSGLRRSLRSGLLPAVFACGRRHMATTHQFLLQFFKTFFPRPLFSTPSSKSHLMLSSPQIQLLSMISPTCSRLGKSSATCYHFGSIWLIPNDRSPATTNSVIALLPTSISNVVPAAQFRAIVLEPVSAKPGTGNTASFAKCFDSATDRAPSQILCAKDRIFLRALLIHELTAHGASIAREYRAVASRWSLDRAVPCTVFDYRSGIAQIQVLPLLAIVPGIDNAHRSHRG
ncbi:hypothetical protein B0H14DRAFT_3478420 [Mycena olivaceomarginata]|nr:hypothetical protein B0H14DRAFT_3478420 [Mycena olivaceomarginata]